MNALSAILLTTATIPVATPTACGTTALTPSCSLWSLTISESKLWSALTPNTSSLPFANSIGSLLIGPAPVILALPLNGTTKPEPLTYLCLATSPLPYTASSIRYPPPKRIHLMHGSSRPTAPPSKSHLLRTLSPVLTPKAPRVSKNCRYPIILRPRG